MSERLTRNYIIIIKIGAYIFGTSVAIIYLVPNMHPVFSNIICNENDQLIKTIFPGDQMILYYYDSDGHVWKRELYPLYEVEYEGPLTTTFTFDTKKNPFHHHDTRPSLPLILNRNNIVGWETLSPITGEVVSRSSIDYEYNSEGYPISALQTVVSPLTDPQPHTEITFTEYEYVK